MPPESPYCFFIEDLTPTQSESLCQLLNKPPGTSTQSWLTDQHSLLSSSTFPTELLRPSEIFIRLLMRLPFTAKNAYLCSTHKPLNAQLIRRVFLQVTAQVTTALERLRSCTPSLVTPEFLAFIRRLEAVNSLWMSSEMYRVAFQAQPEDVRFDRVKNGCEACILSHIGGNKHVLVDLRANTVSRKRRGRIPGTLLPLVEQWISWTGERETLIRDSDELAKVVRGVRRAHKRLRYSAKPEEKVESFQGHWNKERRRGTKEWTESIRPENGLAIDDDEPEAGNFEAAPETENDFEGSIISFYRGIMTDVPPLFGADRASLIHPAFRTSTDETTPQPSAGPRIPIAPTAETVSSSSYRRNSTTSNSASYQDDSNISPRTSVSPSSSLRTSRGGKKFSAHPFTRSSSIYSQVSGFNNPTPFIASDFPKELTEKAQAKAREYQDLINLGPSRSEQPRPAEGQTIEQMKFRSGLSRWSFAEK